MWAKYRLNLNLNQGQPPKDGWVFSSWNDFPSEISNRTHWTDPEKTWVSNISIAPYLGVRWDSVPFNFSWIFGKKSVPFGLFFFEMFVSQQSYCLMVQKSHSQPPLGCIKNLVNSGISSILSTGDRRISEPSTVISGDMPQIYQYICCLFHHPQWLRYQPKNPQHHHLNNGKAGRKPCLSPSEVLNPSIELQWPGEIALWHQRL